jgi:XTP/dITP diphosphohydrolase
MLALSDDSGLEVAALEGAPGINSARWAGPNKAFDLAMARVNRDLKALGTSDRRANFTCALAVATPDGEAAAFTGKVHGTLVWPPRGTRGFGYDPIFVPKGYSETFGEMEPGLKNQLSHRMRAFERLMLALYVDDER